MKNNYKVVDDAVSLKDAISKLKWKVKRGDSRFIAVDCEGVSLSRNGALTIITVATEEKVYIFDVFKLGQVTFSSGLGEILEDKSCTKLMFDCREDSDALWHQFNVKLTGVLDVQLLEILYRRENDTAFTSQFFSTRYTHRNQRTHNQVESIYGFRRCLELYLKDENLIRMKDEGRVLLKGDEQVWQKRPLSNNLIQYCIVDTMAMFSLYDKLKGILNGTDHIRLRTASARYADMIRCKTRRCFDEYEKNALLPLRIIPDKGTIYFPPANTACTCCHRLFPRDEFWVAELRRGAQKCRVCKEITRRAGVRMNRQYNWARNWGRGEAAPFVTKSLKFDPWAREKPCGFDARERGNPQDLDPRTRENPWGSWWGIVLMLVIIVAVFVLKAIF